VRLDHVISNTVQEYASHFMTLSWHAHSAKYYGEINCILMFKTFSLSLIRLSVVRLNNK